MMQSLHDPFRHRIEKVPLRILGTPEGLACAYASGIERTRSLKRGPVFQIRTLRLGCAASAFRTQVAGLRDSARYMAASMKIRATQNDATGLSSKTIMLQRMPAATAR